MSTKQPTRTSKVRISPVRSASTPAPSEAPAPATATSAKRAAVETVLDLEKQVQELLDAAEVKRAELTKAIESLIAEHGNGPWSLGGQVLRVRVREGRGQVVRTAEAIEKL